MVLARFVDRVIARLKETPVDFGPIVKDGARGSLLHGAAGTALFLHEVARLRGDDEALLLARRWCDLTRTWAAEAPPSEWNDAPYGFMTGEAGLFFVEALLAARGGDHAGVVGAVDGIGRMADGVGERTSRITRPTEYLGGAAGLVALTRELAARLPSAAAYVASRHVLARARARALAIVSARYAEPIAPAQGDPLGFAHGIAGELWALVVERGAADPTVRARLDELAALGEADEEGLVYWPASPGALTIELLGTWCNGIAGHALLWCEVARQTRAEEALARARKCAETVGVLRNGTASICCGHAGQALALERYADLVGDAKTRRRAYSRLTSAARMVEAQASHPESVFVGLWQGALGVALVAMGRLAGERGVVCLGA